MKMKWGSKKTEKIVAKVVDQKSANKPSDKTADSFAVADKDTTKVRAVDGNATA